MYGCYTKANEKTKKLVQVINLVEYKKTEYESKQHNKKLKLS